jgi:hypothetical protein
MMVMIILMITASFISVMLRLCCRPQVWPSINTLGASCGLLATLALMVLLGLRESASLAEAILGLHVITITALCLTR